MGRPYLRAHISPPLCGRFRGLTRAVAQGLFPVLLFRPSPLPSASVPAFLLAPLGSGRGPRLLTPGGFSDRQLPTSPSSPVGTQEAQRQPGPSGDSLPLEAPALGFLQGWEVGAVPVCRFRLHGLGTLNCIW